MTNCHEAYHFINNNSIAPLFGSRDDKPRRCSFSKYRQPWIPTWWLHGFNIRQIITITKLVCWKRKKSITRHQLSPTYVLNWWRWWVPFHTPCWTANCLVHIRLRCGWKSICPGKRCEYTGSCAFIYFGRQWHDCKE